VFCCSSFKCGGVFNEVGVSFACNLLSSSSSSKVSLGLSVDVLSSFFSEGLGSEATPSHELMISLASLFSFPLLFWLSFMHYLVFLGGGMVFHLQGAIVQ